MNWYPSVIFLHRRQPIATDCKGTIVYDLNGRGLWRLRYYDPNPVRQLATRLLLDDEPILPLCAWLNTYHAELLEV